LFEAIFVAIHCSLPAIRNGSDFLTMYSSNKLSRFPCYTKLVLLP